MDVLLNWVWQGIAVALATAAVLRVVPRSRTRARYAIVCTAYLAIVILPAVPILLSAVAATPVPPGAVEAATLPAAAPVAIPSVWWTTAGAALTLWSVWALVSSWRTATAVVAVRRAKRNARTLPPDVEGRLAHWRRLQATGRPARLAISEDVSTAGVLGGRLPIIALAPVLLDSLDPCDLDRVIAHEWAHVQRRDDIAQFGVRLVRAIAGWHPAVWWLERQLHVEREVACDEMAIAATGSAKTYATCLTTLAAIPAGRARVPALAAVSSSGLRERVVRIVTFRQTTPRRAPRLTIVAGAAVVTGVTLLVGQVPIVGAVVPAVAREAIDHDMVLMVASAPPQATAASSAVPVRRIVASRASALPPTQPSRQDDGGANVAVTEVPPAPLPAGALVAAAAFEPPARIDGARPSSAPAFDGEIDITQPTQEPAWGKAVDAGKAIGARSEQAAVAAAGFFTRVGKQVARSF